jgi:glucose/arabinose dehydrogenase
MHVCAVCVPTWDARRRHRCRIRWDLFRRCPWGPDMAIQVFSRFSGSDCDATGQNPCALAYTSDLIAAMEHVHDMREQHPVAAVNMSLGGGVFLSAAECDADNGPTKAIVDLLRSVGVATVISAGNNGASNGISAPGCISSAISVGSTTKANVISSFSNSAAFLSLLAPGSSIRSSVPGGGFAYFSGTSMAAPHVAGAWAVIKQKNPIATVAAILDALAATGMSVTNPNNGTAKPRIDVAGAVALVSPQAFLQFTLSVTKTGSGVVTSVPAGVACGVDCSQSYPSDTVITLSATPDAGYSFTGWTGDADCADGSVRMTTGKVCTATFIDGTPPVGMITINRNASVTPTTAVSVNLTASDGAGVTGYYLSKINTPPTSGAAGWVTVTPTKGYSATVPFALTSGEATKTVFAWYKDAGGNVSATASASIKLQTLATSLAPPSIVLEQVATGLAFPVSITHAGDGTGRLFIVLQQGKIVIYDGTRILPTAFLDLTSLVSCCGERGLLGVAFHRNYATNGFFYVNYTNTGGNTVIARYKVTANPNIADFNSAVPVLTIAQPYTNHKGGQLQFGPDGYLYIGTGDGGSGGDPENRAQNLGELLGKILRIDVNAGSPYTVPSNNPFVGTAGAKPEIWALGLRNPWRFSFDRLTGDLFIGDVGQSAREEVDLQPATSAGGENYGWRKMEGTACFNPSSGCNNGTLTLPILEYTHASGDCTVIGGYRYRGTRVSGLGGTYIYGDFCTGRIWGATPSGALWSTTALLDLPFQISTFGEDQAGELYIAQYGAAGAISRIKSAASPALSVNGNSTPITVAPGATVTVGVQDGPGNRTDRIALYLTGAADSAYLDWFYLNGTKTAPASGMTTATISFALPSTSGIYEFPFFINDGATKLTTSSSVTVQSGGGAPALGLAYNGRLRDRVGLSNAGLSPDTALDGIFTVTLKAGSGARTVTGLRLRDSGTGAWDTRLDTAVVVLGAAPALDAPLYNSATTAVNFLVSDGGSFTIFAGDDVPPRLFPPGQTFTLTVTFSDSTTATVTTSIPGSL